MKTNDSDTTAKKKKILKPIPFIISILVGIIIWFIPAPAKVDIIGWHTLAVFLSIIVGCILDAAPMGLYALIGIAVLSVTQTLPVKEVFSGYASKTVWLIVIAYCVSIGFRKTGLGERIAYKMVEIFGKNSLTLGYSLLLCDLVVAPLIPSNTARGAGVVFPIATSLSESLGSKPNDGTARKIGAFLLLVSFHANLITGAMFLTGMGTNPIAIALAKNVANVDITWGGWFLAALIPGLISLIVIPLLLYALYRPEMTQMPEAKEMVKQELKRMGPVKKSEKQMIVSFILMIILWVFGKQLHVNTTITAIIGLCILLILNVVEWKDVTSERSAWNILLWLGPLMMMASQLSKYGVIAWFSKIVQENVHGLSWQIATIILAIVYYYSHYLFTSTIVHMQAMYAPFLSILIGLGAPAMPIALLFAFLTCMCAATTHYGTGTAPVYFGAGYVKQSKWWKLGFIVSVFELVVWIGIGFLWWKILGLY